MLDPEFDELPKGRPSQAWRISRRKLIGLAFFTWLGSSMLGVSGCSRRSYTCAVCREEKVDQRFLILGWSERTETDCSEWYRGNVEPSHAHAWAARGYCRRFGIPGLGGGFACSMGTPIAGLSRSWQIKIYQHFDDRLEAKRLFMRLGRWDNESHVLLNALMEWSNADYPGTWHDWWEKHRAASEE
jgi:hypothetical protein